MTTPQLGHREEFPPSGLNASLDGGFDVPTGNAQQTEALVNQEHSVLGRCRIPTTSARACETFHVFSSRWLFLLESAAGHRALFSQEKSDASWARHGGVGPPTAGMREKSPLGEGTATACLEEKSHLRCEPWWDLSCSALA